MAGVAGFAALYKQARLVAWLRWRVFVNGLRGRAGRADLIAKIIAIAMMAPIVLGLAALLALGAWFAISRHRPSILQGEFWLLFLAWLLLPIFLSGFGGESDPASLLRFPLRYSTFVLLTLAYGLFDPVALGAIFCLVAILGGLAAASTGALLWGAPAVASLASVSLLLNRTLFVWLSRWLAKRRTREALGVLFVLFMLSFQLIGPLARRWGKQGVSVAMRAAPVARFLPPGLAGLAIVRTDSQVAGPLAAMAGLLGCCAALGWLLHIRLWAEFRGENLSEARTPDRAAPTPAVRVGWRVAGVSAPVAALLEKDLRYLARNTSQYIALVGPLILVAIFSFNRVGSSAHQPAFLRTSAGFFAATIVCCLLVVAGFSYNSLGYDGSGVAMLFAAPVRFRDVLLAKNLLHALLLAVEVTLAGALAWLLVGPPPAEVAVVTLAALPFASLANLAAGDLCTLYFARKLNFGQMRRQRASAVVVLVHLGIQICLAGMVAAVCLLALLAGSLWWAAPAFVGIGEIMFLGYWRVLNATSSIALRRRDALVSEFCR